MNKPKEALNKGRPNGCPPSDDQDDDAEAWEPRPQLHSSGAQDILRAVEAETCQSESTGGEGRGQEEEEEDEEAGGADLKDDYSPCCRGPK